MRPLSLSVNGRSVTVRVEPRTHLADALREALNLTGTHLGCEHGVCGACTLLIDGEPARSCITFAVACAGTSITTIEGLDEDEVAAELRSAFSREHALQCGYCTPGMLIAARDLVQRLDVATEQDIRIAMSGNLCRCTGYVGMVRAVTSVIAARRARGLAPARKERRLGPVGAGHGGAVASSGEARGPVARPPAPVPALGDASGDFVPDTVLEEVIVVARPPETVWAALGRIEEVVRCLPGAALVGAPRDGEVEGRITVRLGPMTATFEGAAEITRNGATRTGRIRGRGRDARLGAATRGAIVYRVKEGEASGSTRIDLEIGYTLTGALAQFARAGLARDVARRLTTAFAANLEALMAGGQVAEAPAALDAGGLVFGAILTRLAALWRRVVGR